MEQNQHHPSLIRCYACRYWHPIDPVHGHCPRLYQEATTVPSPLFGINIFRVVEDQQPEKISTKYVNYFITAGLFSCVFAIASEERPAKAGKGEKSESIQNVVDIGAHISGGDNDPGRRLRHVPQGGKGNPFLTGGPPSRGDLPTKDE